jgi:hypothetical protein
MQVIATTHSPLTAQQAGENELYGLKKEKGKVYLLPFVGSPKNLLVNQMLMSPVFGIETDESLVIQEMKEEYTRLRKLPASKRSKNENKTLQDYKTQLANLPERPIAMKNELAHNELLRKIENKLK